jgi:hypothetical protein
MSDTRLSSWIQHYTVFRREGRPETVIRRFGLLLAKVFERKASSLSPRGKTSRPTPRQELAASILRLQAKRARALASSARALTADQSTAKIATAVFANVLLDGGFCETLEAVSREGARGRAPRTRKGGSGGD